MPPATNALDAIARALAPYLGENMARAAVRGQATQLGVRGESPNADELERLLSVLGPGLAVFVGRDKTRGILDEVRATLGLVGGRS